MALVGPVAGFEQHGAEEADLGDFAADAVDLDPVADADAVAAHEDEPAEEGEDEILEDDGEAGGGEADDRGHLLRCAEDDERDAEQGEELGGEGDDGFEGADAAEIGGDAANGHAAEDGGERGEEDDERDPGERLQNRDGRRCGAGSDTCACQRLVDGGELLLGLARSSRMLMMTRARGRGFRAA